MVRSSTVEGVKQGDMLLRIGENPPVAVDHAIVSPLVGIDKTGKRAPRSRRSVSLQLRRSVEIKCQTDAELALEAAGSEPGSQVLLKQSAAGRESQQWVLEKHATDNKKIMIKTRSGLVLTAYTDSDKIELASAAGDATHQQLQWW